MSLVRYLQDKFGIITRLQMTSIPETSIRSGTFFGNKVQQNPQGKLGIFESTL